MNVGNKSVSILETIRNFKPNYDRDGTCHIHLQLKSKMAGAIKNYLGNVSISGFYADVSTKFGL